MVSYSAMHLHETLDRARHLPIAVAAEKKAAELLVPKLSDAIVYCSAKKTEFAPGALTEVVQQVREGNQLIIVGPHKSIFDGAVMAYNVVRFIKPILEDEGWKVAMVMTGAFQTGHLGPFLQVMSTEMESQAQRYGIDEIWPVLRKKDLDKGIKPTAEHNTSLRNIVRSAKNKYALVIFPEGTVQGGRQRQLFHPFNNATFGMQEPLTDTLGRMIDWAAKSGRGISFLPVGITGTNKIFSPDLSLPTGKGLLATYLKHNLGTVEVKIGDPVNGKSLLALAEKQAQDKAEVYKIASKLVVKQVAALCPEADQGVYKGASFYS